MFAKTFALNQIINFTGTSEDGGGTNGAYVLVNGASANFTVPNDTSGPVQFRLTEFAFDHPAGPSWMALDLRFVLDGKPMAETRFKRPMPQFGLIMIGPSLTAGFHMIEVQARTVLVSGPATNDVLLFGSATISVTELPEDIDSAVDRCGALPQVVSSSTDIGSPQTSVVDVNQVRYIITEQHRRFISDVIEHAYLQDIATLGVWPGQIIQGKALLAGDIAPVGPLSRQSGTLSVSPDVIAQNPGISHSAPVDQPDAGSINHARQQIINALNPIAGTGSLKTVFSKVSTYRETGAKLGISVKGSTFGVDANASLNYDYKTSTVLAVIRQIFYTATFNPSGARAKGFWTNNVKLNNLQPYMGHANPPLYVDSVQYGRFICISVQGHHSSEKLSAALKVTYEASVNVGVNIDAHTKQVLDNSEVKIYTIGVPGNNNFKQLMSPIADLEQIFRDGSAFSLANPGSPISFTCRHISDNTLARVALVAEYVQPLSAQGEDVVDRSFSVWDGPGGGLVDTRIRVNPGDHVTVSARGKTWSGVWFSPPHEPDGWIGNRGNNNPLPTGTSFCLIIRFGMGNWIEAGKFWEGTPGSPGVLQLNINDNNPYNGDGDRVLVNRWKVLVSVKRAGAGAAGIYV